MASQFQCGTPNRRERILDPTYDGKLLNGIDYLEVIDHDAPIGYSPQQTLIVKLFQPVPTTLTVAQVVITGGVRYPNVKVVSAKRLVDLTLSASESAYFDPRFPDAASKQRVLLVGTDSFGDFSTYTLTLQRQASDATPPDGFDPVLSHVDFSFKVECPAPFDCKPVDNCPPEVVQPPAIDYLAKDFNSFRRVMLDRISALSPDWTERNAADAGIVVVEALAYAADSLSYYQDAVATEAYLGTARRRLSVRRHARLLDYFMHEGTNARTFVCVEVDASVAAAGVVLPRKNPDKSISIFLTRSTEQVRLAPDPTVLANLKLTQQPRLFEPLQDSLLFPSHNKIGFYTWGDDRCCLPKGATRATLRDDDSDPSNRLRLMAGDVLIFEEWLGRESGLPEDADPVRRQAVRLISVSPSASRAIDDPTSPRTAGTVARDPLTGQAVVEIEWHVDDALTFPVCVSTLDAAGKPLEDVSGARGNAVLVDDGQTVVEPLNPATFDDPLTYRPTLAKPEVTHAVPLPDPSSANVAVSAVLTQDPHAAVPSVTLLGAGDKWTAVPDLLRADRFAEELVVEMDEGGFAELRFGDGVLGREPVENMIATYRVGRGTGGNVGAESIAHVMTSATAINVVRNPLPALGGIDPEALREVKLYAPQAFRVQERAVTEADYAAVAERHPEVTRAVATRRWTGSWYTVFITIERANGRPVDAAFRDDVAGFLETYRLAGEDVEIEPPIFVPLDLTLVVCVAPGYFRDRVEQALLSRFSTATSLPDGTPGFFAPDQFTFGQKVYLSRVIGAAMSVPGVDWVDPRDPSFVFQRANELPAGEIDLGYIPMERLEIARCDNSPSAPENGQLSFVMMGGQ